MIEREPKSAALSAVLVSLSQNRRILAPGTEPADGGVKLMEPSTVLSLIDDQLEVLRQGKGQLD